MLLAQLRQRTAALHERAEEAVNLPMRLRSLAAYRQLLGRFYGYYAPLEARLEVVAAAGPVGLDWQLRQKTPLLHRDLLALGTAVTAVDALPRCTALPAIDDVDAALGCLYVLEGATLGGQVISRRVKQHLGLGVNSGCAFFSGDPAKTRSAWSEFCRVLDQCGTRRPAAQPRVIAAAIETFATLTDWIEGDELVC